MRSRLAAALALAAVLALGGCGKERYQMERLGSGSLWLRLDTRTGEVVVFDPYRREILHRLTPADFEP